MGTLKSLQNLKRTKSAQCSKHTHVSLVEMFFENTFFN